MSPSADPAAKRDLSVLNLVTSKDAEFFTQQVRGVEQRGVTTTTIPVPGTHRARSEVTTRSFTDYLRFFRLVRRQPLDRFDLIHANYGLTAPAALAQRQLPVVLSLWGGDVFGTFGPVSKLCAFGCDAVIVMSPAMRTELPVESAVIPHGVDLDRFKPMPQRDAQRRIGWNPSEWHVLFPYPTSRTVKDYSRTERIVERARARVDDRIRIQTTGGRVPHSEMPIYMNAADALLLTSRREGSPNTVKEAMACNLPVVSTDVGDVSERLRGVSPSFVCETDDELVNGLVTVLERGTRSNGREQVSELSLENVACRIVELYDRVLDRS